MADGQFSLTRRALLGAACVPALTDPRPAEARGPLHQPAAGPPPRSGEEWEAALGVFVAARAEVAQVEAATAGASVDEEEAWLPRHDAACARMEAAAGRVVALPAPDLSAFAAKLELLFAHGIEPDAVEEGWVEAIREDARRLL